MAASPDVVEYVVIVLDSVPQLVPVKMIVKVFVTNTWAFVTVWKLVERLARAIAAPYLLNIYFVAGTVVYLNADKLDVIVTSNMDWHYVTVPVFTVTSVSDPSV
jgi:hypothetical protein